MSHDAPAAGGGAGGGGDDVPVEVQSESNSADYFNSRLRVRKCIRSLQDFEEWKKSGSREELSLFVKHLTDCLSSTSSGSGSGSSTTPGASSDGDSATGAACRLVLVLALEQVLVQLLVLMPVLACC
jgi:hypothetical protein